MPCVYATPFPPRAVSLLASCPRLWYTPLMDIHAPWYVIRVKNGLHCPDMGGTGIFFQPTCEVSRYNRRYRKVIKYEAPLFPGYAFVQTFEARLVRRRLGSFFIGFARSDSGDYLTINQDEIDLLGVVIQNASEHNFRPGARVKLKDESLFTDYLGEVVSVSPDGFLDISFGGESFHIVQTAHHSGVFHA